MVSVNPNLDQLWWTAVADAECRRRVHWTDGVTFTPGTRFMMNSAATVALGWPTSLGLQKVGSES